MAIKVCYVLSYNPPNYVRTEVLLAMLGVIPGVKLFRAMNTRKGPTRYIQTIIRLMIIRLRYNPSIYILGFRGYDIYWPVRLLTLGKPLMYDEFINPYLWFVDEHKKFRDKSLMSHVIKQFSRLMALSSQKVLTDTKLSANYSSQVMHIPASKYLPLYVGTNETLFDVVDQDHPRDASMPLSVFFYGNLLPLHGVTVILEVASRLRDEPVHFTIIGGLKRAKDMEDLSRFVIDEGLENLTHKSWVPYEDLPGYIANADLCLGGPFGGTPQAHLVITGKTYQFLAMGKCTVVGRVDEQVGFVDKTNCLLVNQDSPDSLEGAIRWALQNRDRLPAIGLGGKRLYQTSFSQDAQSHLLGKLIRDLVG